MESQGVISLRVKLFADGADLGAIRQLADNTQIAGFTTNPTLMRKAGIVDYRAFARDVVQIVGNRPVSFEVFSDDLEEMELQAREIASWGAQVFVKIPVTNTHGEFTGRLIRRLSAAGVRVNATAILTLDQVERVVDCFAPGMPGFVSVFAGRIADTGRDPVPMMARAVELLRARPRTELIWASPRELLNVLQANDVGCHVITATSDVLAKLSLIGRDLTEYSLDTVKMFRQDAVAAGFDIPVTRRRRVPARVVRRPEPQPSL
jgi:transaldolase